MIGALLEQYHMMTDELYRVHDKEQEGIISSFAKMIISKQNPSTDTTKPEKEPEMYIKREHAKFALLCRRIAANCQLMFYGCNDYKKQLQQDISEAAEKAKNLEYKWKIDNAVISDTLDVVLALCPSCENILKAHLGIRYRSLWRNDGEVSSDLYYLFNMAADYYRQRGWAEQSDILLEYLCFISGKRNSAERHRELVVKVLARIGDDGPEVVCRIGKDHAGQFEGIINEDAGNFFWFYASSLSRLKSMEAAGDSFNKCYHIREILYGEDDWYTALAKNEYYKIVFLCSGCQNGLEELLAFIDQSEGGLYEDIDRENYAAAVGKTLYITLMDKSNLRTMPEYDAYLRLFERICDQCDDTVDPLLKKRVAKNMRGRYWAEKGDYMQAEMAFQDALHMEKIVGVPEIITDARIKSNLLLAYCLQNDNDQAVPLLMELLDLIADDEHEGDLTERDIYRVYVSKIYMEMQSLISLDMKEIGGLKEIVMDTCQDVWKNKSEILEYAGELAVFLLYSILQLIQNECVSVKEQRLFLTALCEIEKDISVFPLDTGRRVLLYQIMSILAWNLGIPKSEHYIKKSVALLETGILPHDTRASVLHTAATYFGKKGKIDKAIGYIDRSLNELTLAWQSYVRYLNDMRLMQILYPTQMLFRSCYAIFREYADIEAAYEKVLQFKTLASLAGRERNRILSYGEYDKNLLDEIRNLQDRIAILETGQMLRDATDEYAETERKLRCLEAKFAQQFPCSHAFADITLNKVKKAMPNNVVVIEYFCCALDYKIQLPDKKEDTDYTGIDIYIIQNDTSRFGGIKRITVSNGLAVLEDAYNFVNILQAESDGSASIEQIYEKEDVRIRLYQNLIAPVLPYIQETQDVYIAPDYNLVNLPFEILSDEEEIKLGDNYSVVKIESARDFLFSQPGCPVTKGNLIIGNPQYEVDGRKLGVLQKDEAEKRSLFIRDADNIRQLPFSELEVQRIGRRSQSRYYSGADASKKLLLSAAGYKNIHIATHGFFDLMDNDRTLYSSCMLFAGVKNWVRTGEISERYGNGIVTADEISRLDLRSVELVVLSSCLNGMSDVTENKEFYGMVGALSAAGVHYVVSHLWSADDFGTAVLMDMFYFFYMEKKLAPPKALKMAKDYLRNVTIGQLREQNWFAYIKDYLPHLYSGKMVQEYEKYDDEIRPFKSEAYWAGFLCYRCNG